MPGLYVPSATDPDVVAFSTRRGHTFLCHELTASGSHRLRAGSTVSNWMGYDQIARAGQFAATTTFYAGVLPAIFYIQTIVSHTSLHGANSAAQHAENDLRDDCKHGVGFGPCAQCAANAKLENG